MDVTQLEPNAHPLSLGWMRYVSPEEDSGRWHGFRFRPGDIVISTRSKSGTTWLQMICALLIFQTPDPPSPLSALSPWFDRLTTSKAELEARLEAQQHRRFIKTHTPLDGIPIDRRATYIVVARNPLDMAVSLYHQGNNLNRERIRQLTGQREPAEPPKPRPPLREWLLGWIDKDASHLDEMDSLRGVMWHLTDAWTRRESPNIILLHYDDLLQDLEFQMRNLAGLLEIDVPEFVWPTLVEAATFTSMRAHADKLAPSRSGILKDPAAFFRRGVSGAGREVLTDRELAHYHDRVSRMAPPELLTWLHR
jgi:aryl sulfotransferase